MPDDDRDWLEEADEEYERFKDFVEVQWVPTGRQGGGSSAFQCLRCGCLVLNIDQHRWNCGADVDGKVGHVDELVTAVQRTLGIKPHGDQWQTVADRLRWINQRLEMVTRELGITHRGPSDAPGGPEAAARAQRTLDDDWLNWGDIQREASKRLGQAIDRYLKGGK